MITQKYAYPDGKFATFVVSFVFVLAALRERTSFPRQCERRFPHHRQVDSLTRGEEIAFLVPN